MEDRFVSMHKILSIRELRKAYGEKIAVDRISFEVNRNEIVGLLGPNGAGKTTTISMILGVLQPDSGSIHIEGADLALHRAQALGNTNFAAVYAPLPGNLTVQQNLRVFGLLYGVKGLSDRINALVRQFDLETLRTMKCGALSSGEQTRVALAKAMLNEPHLLLLDEPTASLDPSAAHEIRARIQIGSAGPCPRESRRALRWPRLCSTNRTCFCLMNRPHPSTPRRRTRSGPGFATSPCRAAWACCGPRTICTRSRMCATACSSSPMERSCSKAIRRHCRTSTARKRWRSFSSRWPVNRSPWNEANVFPPRHSSRASVLLPAPQHPSPLGADLRMGRHRYRAVGIHQQVFEQRHVLWPQLRALDQFRKHQPDVTLMDLRLPRMSGVEAIQRIRSEAPQARIV